MLGSVIVFLAVQ